MSGAESGPPSVAGPSAAGPSYAEIVDAHLAAAGITVTPAEREMYVADYPIIRAITAKLYEFDDELESWLLFDPASFYCPDFYDADFYGGEPA